GGTLSEEAADAFEEHLFGCDRCERELRRAVEVRAALSRARTDPVVPEALPIAKRWVGTFALSAAAAIALVLGLGSWLSRALEPVHRDQVGPTRPTIALEPLRGAETPPIAASATFSGENFTVTWKPPRATFDSAGKPRSRRYVVQFFGDDGAPLYSVTTAGTSVAAALTGPMRVTAFYWSVQEVDDDGVAVARSELQRAVRPSVR
ncbi:MAG: zf-HC2 domain-containing protein, partial [Acidobacteriota bacterium]